MKTKMKFKMYSIVALFMILFSCNGFTQNSEIPSITKTFNLNQPGQLKARSSGGGISVKTNNEHKVIVQVFIRKNGKILSPTDPMIKEVLNDFHLEIAQNGTEITALVERRSNLNFWKNIGISLSISVPVEMSCNVSSSGGGVTISGVAGNHKFSSSGGGVSIENITGNTEASSSGGGVKVNGFKGEIHVSSSGGGVSVHNAHGKIFAHSSGGGVKIVDVKGDVEAGSSGGGVSITGEIGYLKANSSGGSVNVNISQLTQELNLHSSGGGIDAVISNGQKLGLDLDLSSDKVNIDLHNFSGRSEKNRVKGTMNKGGIPVYMRASGGNVNVRFVD